MTFKLGDKAVYPAYGVGVISGIESKLVAGQSHDFYVLNILASGTRFLIPKSASERTGLRAIISENEIENIRFIVSTPKKVCMRNWNRRFRDFSTKLRCGSIESIAEVLRDLRGLEKIKELSFSERKMMAKAIELIVTEISACTNATAGAIEEEVKTWLNA